MLNMLRMDFYRLIRSKSLYICLGLLAAASVLCYWMIWLVVTPQGQAAAESLGMAAYLYTAEDFGPQILQQYDTLDMLREICMDGGAYTCILGIFTALFVHMDFHSGFLKNTLSLHRSRWKYICSKTLLAALVNLCILLLLLGLCLLLNLFFGGMLPLAGPGETLFYLSWAWLNTTHHGAAQNHCVVLHQKLCRRHSRHSAAEQRLGSDACGPVHGTVRGQRMDKIHALL